MQCFLLVNPADATINHVCAQACILTQSLLMSFSKGCEPAQTCYQTRRTVIRLQAKCMLAQMCIQTQLALMSLMQAVCCAFVRVSACTQAEAVPQIVQRLVNELSAAVQSGEEAAILHSRRLITALQACLPFSSQNFLHQPLALGSKAIRA